MGKDINDTSIGNTSDGYHTFNELYEHRHHLFIALMQAHPLLSWYSLAHYDDTPMYEGWFVAGMNLPTGQITYHLPIRLLPTWSNIPYRVKGVKWDGHTSEDVVKRLADFIKS